MSLAKLRLDRPNSENCSHPPMARDHLFLGPFMQRVLQAKKNLQKEHQH
jgi:hypothetical protein